MKTVSDPGVPIEECLHVLTWQGVVVEASGNVFVTHSDKMDNLVVKGIAIAFNNMNSVFASTMKDIDQLLADVSRHGVYSVHIRDYRTQTCMHMHTQTHRHKSCNALTILDCCVCCLFPYAAEGGP